MKKFLALLIAVVMVLALAVPAMADEGGKVGIAMPTNSLERWNRDGQYLKEQFEAAGYEAILKFSDNDIEQQNNDIANMIADDVDLLIIAAIDGDGLNTVMNDAAEAGVPVISYGRLIGNDAVQLGKLCTAVIGCSLWKVLDILNGTDLEAIFVTNDEQVFTTSGLSQQQQFAA